LVIYFFVLFIPVVHIEVGDNSVKIKTLTLGEYYTPVEYVEIFEVNNNKTVVTLKAIGDSSRMHTVTIKPGINEFNDMYLDGYMVSYPTPNIYEFKSNTIYGVNVKWTLSIESETFILQTNT